MGQQAVHCSDQVGSALVGQLQSRLEALLEVRHHRRGHHRQLADEDLARGAVDGEHVSLADLDPVGVRQRLSLVDAQGLGPADSGLAHAPRHDGGVRGLAAAAGQDPGRRDHPLEVLGIGLLAQQHDRLTGRCPCDRRHGVEDHLAHRRARRGRHAPGERRALAVGVELREHQLGQLRSADPLQRLVHGDQLLVHQLRGDAERCRGGALPDAGLEHPELAALDGELDVAQVAVVGLQAPHDLAERLVGRGVDLREVVQRQRVADPGDDVLALRVDEVVAVPAGFARGRVPGEADPGAGGLAQVAEDHRADVHRSAGVLGDALAPPVDASAIGVPGLEHGSDRQVELFAGVLREGPPGPGLHHGLEVLDQLA